jgi:hypothetical protein
MQTVGTNDHSEIHESTNPDLPIFEDGECPSPAVMFVGRVPNILHESVNNEFPLGFSEELGFFREVGNDKVSDDRQQTSRNSLQDEDLKRLEAVHGAERGSYSTPNHRGL